MRWIFDRRIAGALALIAWLGPAAGQTDGTYMARRADVGATGEVYRTVPGADVVACESQCLRDAECNLFVFRRSPQTCVLYRNGEVAGEAKEQVVGVKRRPVAPTMKRIPTSAYVEGEGYDTILHSTPDACEAYCLADRKCMMSELYKPERKCNIFDHRNWVATTGDDAIVAIKDQQ